MSLVDEFLPGRTTTVLLVVLAVVVGYAAVTVTVGDESLDAEKVETLVVEETNEVRDAHGVQSVETDSSLREPARRHAEDMARHGYVGHETPEGELPYQRYADCVEEGYSGENVANTWHNINIMTDRGEVPTAHLSDEREVAEHLVESWMASDGHRTTLLNDDWTRIGVGVAVTDENEVFAVQAFCSEPFVD